MLSTESKVRLAPVAHQLEEIGADVFLLNFIGDEFFTHLALLDRFPEQRNEEVFLILIGMGPVLARGHPKRSEALADAL
jgi:hypothetical protein